MKNLVACFDGTWNRQDADHPTSIVRLHRATIALDDQLTYYDEGVGTERLNKYRGGLFGHGLRQNVLAAYLWLADNVESQFDRVFLFGFSRGAYTARAVAAIVGRCGLPATPRLAREALDAFAKPDGKSRNLACARILQTNLGARPRTPIKFLGVFDTVGRHGIPLGRFQKMTHRRAAFHDRRLNLHVEHAAHALAFHESRPLFEPTIWESGSPDHVQAWFPGVHSDAGGGTERRGLADRALLWVLARAHAQGLKANRDVIAHLLPEDDEPAGRRGFWRLGRRDDRETASARTYVHWSLINHVRKRQNDPRHLALIRLTSAGEMRVTKPIRAETHPLEVAWNA